MSLTLNILQTLSVQPPPLHWLCDSYFPHPSGCQWKASQAAYSHTCFLERGLALVCWSNPERRPFSQWPLFTHSVNVHIYKQFIVLPESSGTSQKRRDTNKGSLLEVFFPHFLLRPLVPYPVRSIWFEEVQLKTPGLALHKRRFVPGGTATLSTDPCCVNRVCQTDATNRQQQPEALSQELLQYSTDNEFILPSGVQTET